jgi:hypothetical protein
MLVAYIKDGGYNYGLLQASFVSRKRAAEMREMAGDLVFSDSGEIDQGEDWLYDWEKKDSNCYARKQQREKLNVAGFRWILRSDNQHGKQRRRW